MFSINGKKFMNISEAVQWLLDNNALPFQSTANYVADTVIAKSTIINPSPAEIKIGSLVLFADGKVGTVSGITANGFMVGAESTDLSDGVPHITDIDLDASGHLIITMSEGDPIDAGLVKMVSSMSIDASQHLIANYNDGTSTDLGAIFQGDLAIFENITDSQGHKRFVGGTLSNVSSKLSNVYGRWSLSGTHLLVVLACAVADTTQLLDNEVLAQAVLPQWVTDKIYPVVSSIIEYRETKAFASNFTSQDMRFHIDKTANGLAIIKEANLTLTADRQFRIQFDLLIDNA